MILRFIVNEEEELECAVVNSETEFADEDDGESEAVEVCFLDEGAGYSRGEVCYLTLDSFREFAKE